MIQNWLASNIGETLDASNGNELRVNCPFCMARIGKPDEKFHMYVSLQRPAAICFRCSWQGSYISLIISTTGCSYAHALKQLESPTPNIGKFDLIAHPSGLMGMLNRDAMDPRPDGFRHFDFDGKLAKEQLAVWNYLVTRRKIPQPLAMKYMGWAPGTNRAWILVDNHFWQGRLIIQGEPKYISPPWPKGEAIWNPNALSGRYITICEGVFSAIAVGSHAVALCGKSITQLQAKRIAKSKVSSITIMLDADATKFSYDIAHALEEAGYSGVMKIHELRAGDPTDSLDGRVIGFDWAAVVRNRIYAAV